MIKQRLQAVNATRVHDTNSQNFCSLIGKQHNHLWRNFRDIFQSKKNNIGKTWQTSVIITFLLSRLLILITLTSCDDIKSEKQWTLIKQNDNQRMETIDALKQAVFIPIFASQFGIAI